MFMRQICTRQGIGADLAEGPSRAAKKWGTYDKDLADGMEPGRKIFTLDRAIWTIQGRHRDMEVFAHENSHEWVSRYFFSPARIGTGSVFSLGGEGQLYSGLYVQ